MVATDLPTQSCAGALVVDTRLWSDVSVYTQFARFYDRIQGTTPASFARWIRKDVQRLGIEVESILELGSGTGAVLEHLPEAWRKTGVDISAAMMTEASQKELNAELLLGDIRTLRLERTFDVVACVYDTMNHLKPSDWASVFRTAAMHLAPGGVFLFDINTLGRLTRGSLEKASVIEYDSLSVALKITQASVDEFLWTIRVGSDSTKLHDEVVETITEFARPIHEIQAELLAAGFSSVRLSAGRDRTVNDDSPRVFFTCQQ